MHLPEIAICTALLSVVLTTALHAAPADDKHAQVRAMIKDRATAHLAFDEMMKDKENKRYMAKALAKDKDFRTFYNAEVGSGAPHEERNPSQHPKLFRAEQ